MNKLLSLALLTTLLCACTSINQNNSTTNITSTTTASWDNSYGGIDKAYDSQLLKLREEIAPKFQTFEFKDQVTGKTMTYNLFIPKNYDPIKSYPLVQFIADASTVSKGAQAPLKQGYGGIIWATDESQAENPSFVLVPSFSGPDWAVNDQWQISDEVGISLRVLEDVVSRYSIDKNRLYTTGQSMGGMISFYLNATHPDLFTASIFVGSQWDIKALQPLVNDTFFYIVSAGDEKASNGMQTIGNLLHSNGVKYGSIEFSAQLPLAAQNQKVNDLIKQGNRINFIQFSKGSVVPANATKTGSGAEHMYSFDYAYQMKSVRDWLFKQKRNP